MCVCVCVCVCVCEQGRGEVVAPLPLAVHRIVAMSHVESARALNDTVHRFVTALKTGTAPTLRSIDIALQQSSAVAAGSSASAGTSAP